MDPSSIGSGFGFSRGVAFVAVLAERLGTTVEYVEGSNQLPMRKKLMPEWLYSQLQGGYHVFLLTLKRLGLEWAGLVAEASGRSGSRQAVAEASGP